MTYPKRTLIAIDQLFAEMTGTQNASIYRKE